jgi:hypothetical protein
MVGASCVVQEARSSHVAGRGQWGVDWDRQTHEFSDVSIQGYFAQLLEHAPAEHPWIDNSSISPYYAGNGGILMPLNIKDETIHIKAKQLAALTGESLTAVVRHALDERMATVLKQKQASAKARSAEKLMELGRLCAAKMPPGVHSSDHADLYDQNGMPQ